MKIITHQHYSDHWTAIDDNTYDGPGSALGHGATREEAVADLLWKLEDFQPFQYDEQSAQAQDRERNL
jgi:hypothetical protein